MNKPKTFVATVRVDLRGMASIALTLEDHGERKTTISKLASEAIRIITDSSQAKHPVETHDQAIEILRSLGYGKCLRAGTRYFKAVQKQLALEEYNGVKQEEQLTFIKQEEYKIFRQKEEERPPVEKQIYQPSATDLSRAADAGIMSPAEVKEDIERNEDETTNMRNALAKGLPEIIS